MKNQMYLHKVWLRWLFLLVFVCGNLLSTQAAQADSPCSVITHDGLIIADETMCTQDDGIHSMRDNMAVQGGVDPTIDPRQAWNTFLGGIGEDAANDIALDSEGNMYITGFSKATWGAPRRAYVGAYDAFVAKLDSSGSLLWNTFLGSAATEGGYGITVDGNGNVYVTGDSNATWGTPLHNFTIFNDAFVAKLDTNGDLIWNTFVGGYSYEHGTDIAMVGSDVVISGWSDSDWSEGAPTTNYNAFVAKLFSNGNPGWRTFLGGSGEGGSGEDKSSSIAVNGISGDVFVTGRSNSTWGTPIRAYSSDFDTYVAKLDSNGNLGWNTFLGGSMADESLGIAVDSSGNVLVTGKSTGTWSTPLRAYSGAQDAFVTKLTPDGALTWNTFLGGSHDDIGIGIAVNSDNNVYVTGMGGDGWGYPLAPYNGGFDAFVASLSSDGALMRNTNLGSILVDTGTNVAVNGPDIYVTGYSRGTWGTPVRAYSNLADVFVSKLVDVTFTVFVPMILR